MASRPLRILRRLSIVTTAAVVLLAGTTVGSLVLARPQLMAELTDAASTSGSAAIVRVSGSETSGEWVAGSAEEGSGRPLTGDERFRIGSVTKTFVATVIMQLVDEGRVRLDAPINSYLAGLVPGGESITVRQVLNHTSGLYDYMEGADWSTNRWRGEERYRSYSPQELLAEAFDHRPYFPPGEDFRYSNTNYILAGLLIEKVTGQPYGTAVEHRILQPLGLSATSIPGADPELPEPAVRASTKLPDGRTVDATEQNPSLDWAAGEMISNTRDLDVFLDALLGGRLISAASLEAMQTTVPMGMGFHYGLGLQRFELPCGGSLWGHGGQLLGYTTYAYRRADGHSLTLQLSSTESDGFLSFAGLATASFCLT